ncbi:MAG: hypothetical protein FJX33_16110 [Alphaproteobacteria bacterium]|nr:hypothetical protein [Alphaproteobacteria bacterium]
MSMEIDPNWRFTAIEAPVVAALFLMLHCLRRELHARIQRGDDRDWDALTRTREDLAQFKLEVARTYDPLSLIRDLDRRSSGHLIRIEENLEDVSRTGIAAAQAARRMEERE